MVWIIKVHCLILCLELFQLWLLEALSFNRSSFSPPQLLNFWHCKMFQASQGVLVVKNSPASARDIRDVGSTPGLGRSPGGGLGNPLQYSCLQNPKDRGAWQAAVHGAAKSQTWLKRLRTHAHILCMSCMCPAPGPNQSFLQRAVILFNEEWC